jgi:hypothetical protein
VAVVRSAGERTDVLAVASDVARHERIERSDLSVVRVGSDPGLEMIPSGQLDEMVGRVAAVDLVPGSLLAPDQVVQEGQRVVGAGEALVGARLKAGELPPDGVRAGSDVMVVVRPTSPAMTRGGDASAGTVEVQGWLLSLGEADQATGAQSLSLVVPRSAAAGVAAAAADGQVSLVVLEG